VSAPDPARSYDPATVPVRPAATVMLIRDATAPDDGEPAGVEVFMLRRTLAAAFGSGMYVFPGGRVEGSDGDDVDRAHRLAAIRECFEEAGVLLARSEDGAHVSDGHPALAARHGVHDGDVDLLALCAEHHLTPALDELEWVSHWVTPIGESRRFDTRFYLAPAPAEQTSVHDDSETIASLWTRPADALARQAAGELMMMPPTIKNLQLLAGFASTEAAMAAARLMPPPECILPRLRLDADGRLAGVALPGDADYDVLA
jgi:8-oxo-dGTP pyrophosphatase MutT (NUDIX family)